MPIVVSNAGEIRLLDWLLRSTGTNLIMRLYTNAHTPTDASVIGSFTEATFGGYVNKTLVRGTFAAPTTNGAGRAEISYADQSWTATSAQTVTGYYCTDTSGNYMFAEIFPASRALVSGDILVVAPRFTFASE